MNSFMTKCSIENVGRTLVRFVFGVDVDLFADRFDLSGRKFDPIEQHIELVLLSVEMV